MSTLSLQSSQSSKPTSASSSCLTTALRICGWIELIVSVIGGVIIYLYHWAMMPGINTPLPSNPFVIGLAVAIIFQGFVFFAICNVIAGIADNLAALRNDVGI